MSTDEIDDLEQTVMVSRPARWMLEISNGDPVTLSEPFVKIGRKPSRSASEGDTQLVEVIDTTRTVSRNHARLMQVEGAWLIEDLRSANGVVLGSEGDATPVDSGFHPIDDGEFWLGDIHFHIRDMSTPVLFSDDARNDATPEQPVESSDINPHTEAEDTTQTDATDGSAIASEVLTVDDSDSDDVGRVDTNVGDMGATATEVPATEQADATFTGSASSAQATVTEATSGTTPHLTPEPGDVSPVYVATGDTIVCGFCGQWNPKSLGLCRDCGVTLVAPRHRDIQPSVPEPDVASSPGIVPAIATSRAEPVAPFMSATPEMTRRSRPLLWALIGGGAVAVFLAGLVVVTIVVLT